jgi:hypothetical protein
MGNRRSLHYASIRSAQLRTCRPFVAPRYGTILGFVSLRARTRYLNCEFLSACSMKSTGII